MRGAWRQGETPAETTAGGDRTHVSFVDNPQFLVRAAAGTRMTIVLKDLDHDEWVDSGVRPAFLRLCVTAATPEVVRDRRHHLSVNAGGLKLAETIGLHGEPRTPAQRSATRSARSAAPRASSTLSAVCVCTHLHRGLGRAERK